MQPMLTQKESKNILIADTTWQALAPCSLKIAEILQATKSDLVLNSALSFNTEIHG